MPGSEEFRLMMQQRLSAIADDRLRSRGTDLSGHDIKVIDLTRRLAGECAALTEAACERARSASGRFNEALDRLPDDLGLVIWPKDAEELLKDLIADIESRPGPAHASFLQSKVRDR